VTNHPYRSKGRAGRHLPEAVGVRGDPHLGITPSRCQPGSLA
jgi:hypothetical protein